MTCALKVIYRINIVNKEVAQNLIKTIIFGNWPVLSGFSCVTHDDYLQHKGTM